MDVIIQIKNYDGDIWTQLRPWAAKVVTTLMATMWFTKCQAKMEADSNLKGASSHPSEDQKTMPSAKAARWRLFDVSFIDEFNKSSLMARIVGMSRDFW